MRTLPDFGYDPTREQEYEPAPNPLAPPPPTQTVNLKFLPPVGQQGTAASPGAPPTCCAWASTELATFYAAKAGVVDPSEANGQASPAQIYIQVMQTVNEPSSQCAGSAFADYFKILTGSGTPSLSDAPYYSDCQSLWTHYNNAPVAPDARFKVPTPMSVKTSNLDGVKAQIAAGNALVWGTNLYTDWVNYKGPNLPVPYTGNGVLSGAKHCMLIIGYNATGFLIQNSQGTGWGTTVDGQSGTDNCYGYVWMAYDTFSALAEQSALFIPSGG
jgi:C1A family cysteine protease